MAISGSERLISSPSRRAFVLLPLLVTIVFVVVVALGLLPLSSGAGLECEAVLRGGEPKPDLTLAVSIRAQQDKLCADTVAGRKLTMVVVGALGLLLGAGAVFAPADRLERFLTRSGEADADRAWEEEAAREAEARDARIREERALADAQRAARARQEEERLQATGDRRAERVAKARAARLAARAEGAASGQRAGTKKVTKATKKAGTKKLATKKVAGTKAGTKKVAGTKAGTKKVAGTEKAAAVAAIEPATKGDQAKKAATVKKAGAAKKVSTRPRRAGTTPPAAT